MFYIRPAVTSQHRLEQQQLGQVESELPLNRSDKNETSASRRGAPSGHGRGGEVAVRAGELLSAFGGAIVPTPLATTTAGNGRARCRYAVFNWSAASTQTGQSRLRPAGYTAT